MCVCVEVGGWGATNGTCCVHQFNVIRVECDDSLEMIYKDD